MKKLPIGFVECEYIESGAFQGGEEDTSIVGINRGEDCIAMSKADFKAMKSALKDAGVSVVLKEREDEE